MGLGEGRKREKQAFQSGQWNKIMTANSSSRMDDESAGEETETDLVDDHVDGWNVVCEGERRR
jgi:hypothetical protein